MSKQPEGRVAITVKLALIYPRSSVPADVDLILNLCQWLNEEGMKPEEVLVLGHEISSPPIRRRLKR